MFTDKENINILTSLLLQHGIKHAVVCPGSRNAPIVHNLNECGRINCHPITDERSAAFYALGLAQATALPVVICVTSGSALLNVSPAVAEAYYQHIPLIVVSADRPAAWINQLDGQTLPQPNALNPFVRRSVNLPEPKNDTERWSCRRLINEALYLATLREGAPVHINVPISEPLFQFTAQELPHENGLTLLNNADHDAPKKFLELFEKARRPMVVIGQMAKNALQKEVVSRLEQKIVVLREPLSTDCYTHPHFDEVLHATGSATAYMPDIVLYMGDTLVSKRARKFLRAASAPTVFATPDATRISDPLMNLSHIAEYDDPNELLIQLAERVELGPFHHLWQKALQQAEAIAEAFEPTFSQMAVVKCFEEQLADICYDYQIHFANSSAIRLANIYSGHYAWCNRGVNGIEGSLSTAAGFSLATSDMVFCIVGDLSFFYDQNALWNAQLGGNFRILLLNNGGGGIFHQLKGLAQSPVRDSFVAGSHHTTAQGICTQNDIGYISAKNAEEMQLGIVRLLTEQTRRPMLLEVFTNAETDAEVMREYYHSFKENLHLA